VSGASTVRPAGATRRAALAGLGAVAFAPTLSRAQEAPPDDLIGTLDFHVTAKGETMLDLARHKDLGFLELMAANPDVDPWVPVPGTPVVVPTAHVLPAAPRQGLVVNLAELRLYAFLAESNVTHPIGIGRTGYMTPTGSTSIVRKQKAPAWYPTETTRADDPTLPAVVPPGPDNPLGDYALYLGWPSFLIHGTNKPWGVGRLVSRGCIRLYPEDIATLYPSIPVGTPVTVVAQAIKLGRKDGAMFIEVHPTRAQLLELARRGWFASYPVPDVRAMVEDFAGVDARRLRWPVIATALAERRGYPVRID
jgi:L,D-transpeptidase ErfK/SrfK